MKQEIPIYDAVLNDLDGLSCISIVDEPAMLTEMIVFNGQKKPLQFAINDEMEHCITSVVIRADFPIYRYDYRMGEYYIRFGKDIIKQLAEKYSKDGLLNQVSVQHNGVLLDDITMIEYYIKDTEKGISPKGFESIEEGSLFCTFKINNDEVWQQIIDGEFGGLSMEVFCDIELTDEVVEEEIDDDEYEMNNWLAELLSWLADEDDVEVIMSKDKKKTNYKRLTKDDIQEAMSKNRKVNITIGKQTLWEQQITSIGTDRTGNRMIVVFDPQHNDWETYKIHDITAIEVTEAECENLIYNNKWETITNDPMLEIDVTLPSLGMGKDTFDWCMDRNAYCMIEYNDETENPATGFRTCIITSWGYTQKSKGNGNECLRVYEVSGDTKTGFEDGRYRFILTRRIRSFRAVDYVEPSLQAPPLYNGEIQQGSGKRGTMSIVKRTATFPAIKRLDE